MSGRLGRETARNRRQRERRTAVLLKSPKTIGVICSHVRNGGSLINLCETWGVRYSEMIEWVRADKARSIAYTAAGEDRSEWTREMLLNEIRLLARPDMQLLIYPKNHALAGKLKKLSDLDPDTLRLVREVDKDGSFKLYDRMKAIELGAKSEKLLTDKTEISGVVTLEDMLGAANEEPAKPAAPEAKPQ